MIKRITTEVELESLVSGGSLVTGKFALRQGKPLFILTPEGKVEDDVDEVIKRIGCDSEKEKETHSPKLISVPLKAQEPKANKGGSGNENF